MKKLFIFVFLINFIQAGKRDLIIMLDYNQELFGREFANKDMTQYQDTNAYGAITQTTLQALFSKAAPILVTQFTWYNIIARKQLFEDLINPDKSSESIAKKFSEHPYLQDKSSLEILRSLCVRFSRHELTRSETSFYPLIYSLDECSKIDLSGWKMYHVFGSHYILIPDNYLAKINAENLPSQADLKEFGVMTDVKSLNLQELSIKLGIKLNEEVNPNSFFEVSGLKKIPTYKLFINKHDFSQIKDSEKRAIVEELYLHDWYIYLSGHGSQTLPGGNFFISGMPYHVFSELLSFFNDQIKTKIFFYDSCYAGGEHLVYTYALDEVEKYSSKVLNYVTVASTFYYTPTFRSQEEDFEYFFTKLHNYFDYLTSGFNYLVSLFTSVVKGSNFAVRLPGTEWFKPAIFVSGLMNLSRTLIETHEADGRPIKIDKAKKVAIFSPMIWPTKQLQGMYADYFVHEEIMVPITYDVNQMPLDEKFHFVSAAAGNAAYYIEELDAVDDDLIVLFGRFISTYGMQKDNNKILLAADKKNYLRSYFIKKIRCYWPSSESLKKFNRFAGPVELSDVIIHNSKLVNDKMVNQIIFTLNKTKKQYEATWDAGNETDQEKIYLRSYLPNLKIVEHSIEFHYPFKLPKKPKYKNLIEVLKKRKEEEQTYKKMSYRRRALRKNSEMLRA